MPLGLALIEASAESFFSSFLSSLITSLVRLSTELLTISFTLLNNPSGFAVVLPIETKADAEAGLS